MCNMYVMRLFRESDGSNSALEQQVSAEMSEFIIVINIILPSNVFRKKYQKKRVEMALSYSKASGNCTIGVHAFLLH